MKILFLTPWYPDRKTPHHGVFVRDQAVAVGGNHEVVVVSSKVDYDTFKVFGWNLEKSAFEGVTEYRLIVDRSIPFINQVNYLLISIWVTLKIARQFNPDVIHGNIAYPGGIWAYAVSKFISKPFILSDHTSRFTDNFRSLFHRLLTTFSLRRAGNIIAVSTWAAKRIESILGRRVDIIPNLIHVDNYELANCQNPIAQIGFLGGLSSQIHRKGLDVLLTAIRGVQKDYVLHIGGAGSLLEHYKELAQSAGIFEKCRFHGFVDHVPDFMKNFHFFVSSSRVEAFGMVIVEAMTSGLPVITTNSGGPADYVDDACGIMVENENVEQLRRAIEWMIDHHQTFDKESIRLRAVNTFSPQAFVARIGPVYQRLKDPASSLSARRGV